jgi:hypothetical protein
MLDAKVDDVDIAEEMLTMTADDDKQQANQKPASSESTNETDASVESSDKNSESDQTKVSGKFEKKLTVKVVCWFLL